MRTNEQDIALFEDREKFKPAVQDMFYLLSRNYPAKAALALVGNRYEMVKKQQTALLAMACSEQELKNRLQKELHPEQLKDQTLYIDGFNILILLETLLAGGIVFKGLDGCYRDISSVHGTYKQVEQTEAVLLLAGRILQTLGLQKVVWVFDSPVSNSGKLKTYCYELAAQHDFPWEVILHQHPDQFLIEQQVWVCSADAFVLNECAAWFNLSAFIISKGQFGNCIVHAR
jgi:hypothetical protein